MMVSITKTQGKLIQSLVGPRPIFIYLSSRKLQSHLEHLGDEDALWQFGGSAYRVETSMCPSLVLALAGL